MFFMYSKEMLQNNGRLNIVNSLSFELYATQTHVHITLLPTCRYIVWSNINTHMLNLMSLGKSTLYEISNDCTPVLYQIWSENIPHLNNQVVKSSKTKRTKTFGWENKNS